MHEEVKRVTELLEKKFNEIWYKEPADVRKLRTGQVQGAYRQICGPILYAESETREMVDYIGLLINSIKEDKCDINSVKNIVTCFLEYKSKKWSAWYKMEDIKVLFKEVILAIEKSTTKEEILSLLFPFHMFIGKVNFWLDTSIPWLSLSAVFENSLLNK